MWCFLPRQKACQVTCTVFSKYVKKEIVTIVDEEKVCGCECSLWVCVSVSPSLSLSLSLTLSLTLSLSLSLPLQRVKHSKLADGIEQAISENKYLPAGVESDSVRLQVDLNNA